MNAMMKEQGVVVHPTDKSGRFSIDTRENYINCMREHIEKDSVIAENENENIVRQLNGHNSMLARALGLCRGHCTTDDERLSAATREDVHMCPPTLSGLRKDHKKVETGLEEKGPPLRPVCHAYTAPNNILSFIISPIIRAVAQEAENRAISSTEEMIATLKKANQDAESRERKIGIGSMDVKALYPSITREWVRKIGIQMLQDTKVNVKVADWEELALYIALTHDQSTINKIGLEDLVHKIR